MKCRFCGGPVDMRTAYQLVTAWERPGAGMRGHSGSSLVLRERGPVFACPMCITKRQSQVAQGQMRINP